MEEYVGLSILLSFNICFGLIYLIFKYQKPTSYVPLITTLMLSIYLILRLYQKYTYQNVIVTYDIIQQKHYYWAFISNSIIINEYTIFYTSITIFTIFSSLCELIHGHMWIIIITLSTGTYSQFISWMNNKVYRDNYNFYLVQYDSGIISVNSALIMFELSIIIINIIKTYKYQHIGLCIIFPLMLVCINIIDQWTYSLNNTPLNINIGYLMGIMFALIYKLTFAEDKYINNNIEMNNLNELR
jgi:hypothetical protein